MKNSVLMTLPQSDEVTEYLHAFSQEIIFSAKAKGVPINILARERAVRKMFESELRENHRLIIFNGHGSPKVIAGHKNEAIIQKDVNEELLKERITYARSCYSAEGIGRSSMKNSSEGCFIGYSLPFVFYHDMTWSGNPSKDTTAKIFFTTTNKIPNGIIKGKTCKEAHEDSKKAMLKAIKKALIKGNVDSQSIAEALWNNYSFQTIIGNEEARISNA
jgi:hypothetical protein